MFSSSKLALVAVAAATLSGVDATTVYHAPITQYPGAEGTTSGCVEMSCHLDKECTFSGVVGGLPAAHASDGGPVAGKVHVHEGTACTDAAVGGHWKTTDSTPADPWLAGPSITVDTLTGTLSLAANLGTGQTVADMLGKPLVIHGPTGGTAPKVGCGLIVAGACPAAEYYAAITPYPGADGTTNGCVKISCTQPEQVCTFSGAVNGLPAAEVDIAATVNKVHVHAGTACTASDVGLHWTDSGSADPWTSGPSITVASLTGTLSTAATLGAGQSLNAMVGKPLVIHGPTGAGGPKLGCGMVMAGSSCPSTDPAAVAAPASLAALFLAAAAFF